MEVIKQEESNLLNNIDSLQNKHKKFKLDESRKTRKVLRVKTKPKPSACFLDKFYEFEPDLVDEKNYWKKLVKLLNENPKKVKVVSS